MAWASGRFSDFQNTPSRNNNNNNNNNSSLRTPANNTNNSSSVKMEATDCNPISPSLRTPIRDINPYFTTGTTVVGLVLSKRSPRSIPNKNGGNSNNNTDRWVLSFTVRDSPTDTSNVACWGNEAYTKSIYSSFTVGDIVELRSVKFTMKRDQEEKFSPSTTSAYQICMSDIHSSLVLYGGLDIAVLYNLLHLTTIDPTDYYKLGDIVTNGQNLHGELINIMAVLRHVGTVRDIVTKNGRQCRRLELKLFDDSCQAFPLILWDDAWIQLAGKWTPGLTVLFVCDARMSFDDFKQCMIATASMKTIITTDPDSSQAQILYNYAQSHPPVTGDNDDTIDTTSTRVDLSSIHDLYTVNDVKHIYKQAVNVGKVKHGVMYGFISQLDIDSDTSRIGLTRCVQCKKKVDTDTSLCVNPECVSASNFDDSNVESFYDVIVSVSDHTGTLQCCRLENTAAQEMFACSVSDFSQASTDFKTQMKWKYLLERCKIYFKSTGPTPERSIALTRILSCTLANVEEAFNNLQ